MKKVWLIVAVTALCGMAASTFAQVQNIRLSGDVRIRGYYISDAGSSAAGAQVSGSSQFIVQRTRVCVEADLADHVLAVATLKAEGNWGSALTTDFAGAHVWAVGVQEAYVQLRELFYSPATLKAGRQFLNYGDGLILSSANQNYTFDAGRLVLDYHPLVIDVVAGQIANVQGVNAQSTTGQSDLLFVNAKYDGGSSVIKTVEAYFGWMPQDNNGNVLFVPSLLDPKQSNPSPIILGLRTDMAPTENLKASLEGAYELGNNGGYGSAAIDNQISAWLAKAAIKWSPKGVSMSPTINASYTFASGGGANGRNSFVPWFDDVDGMNGYLFQPQLSNIQIINLGGSIKPCANTTLALQGFYYLKADKNVNVNSNPSVDFGGPSFANPGYLTAVNAAPTAAVEAGSREVGWEFDTIIGYDYSNDVRCQLVYAAFIPDNAFGSAVGSANRVANEIRGEINVKF